MNHSNFNAQINAIRRRNNQGVYDIHTNLVQYPSIMQPTQARIEQVPPSSHDAEAPESQIFPPLSPNIPRNFLVTDTHFETPPTGIAAVTYDHTPKTTASARYKPDDPLAPFRGLSAISDEVKACLPPECLEALEKAQAQEEEWHSRWGVEASAKARRVPVIDKAIVPYNVR